MLCVALGVWTRPAFATYRADFFDTSKRPTVAFDKKSLTWTLRNQGVERVVHFDVKAGGLQTLALRDLHTHHVLQPAPDSEGEITFASPLLQSPIPITAWNYTATEPGSQWTQSGYDDKSWRVVADAAKPPRLDAPVYAPLWFRATLPANRLKAGHAYALYLPEGFWFDGEIYADGNLIQRYTGTRSPRLAQAEQIDLPPGCRVIAIRARNGSLHRSRAFLPAYTVEVGTSPPTLRLLDGWQYMIHTVNVGEANSQILTIHLAGVKQYEGFNLDVSYQIYAGEEPTLAKWFSFVSHRKTRFLLDSVVYDRWMLPAPYKPQPLRDDANAPFFVQAVPDTGDVLMVGQMDRVPFYPFASSKSNNPGENKTGENRTGKVSPDQDSLSDTSIAPRSELNAAITPELPLQTPRSLTAFWHGSQGTGLFLYQLYLGQYATRGEPNAVPVAYNTGFAYNNTIDAATCRKIIPLAAGLGAQAFVLGDGWQSNITPDTGRFGDWITDKEKFPGGMLPISTLVRESHLRFGLWIDAARVNSQSQAAALHPDWLMKTAQQSGEEAEDLGERMCFTGAWGRQFTQSIQSLCREQGVTYLQTRFDAQDACLAVSHEHPAGHSRIAEQDNWRTFCDTLHKTVPTLAIVNQEIGYQAPAEAQDANDNTLWLNVAEDLRTRPLEFWRAQLNLSLPNLSGPDLAEDFYAYPTFARNGQALCHRQTEGEAISPAQLDYFWTSVAALYPAFEVQGDLEKMTTEERAAGHRWIDWNLQNRDWLAFAQPLMLTSPDAAPNPALNPAPPAPRREVRGVLHLRNALHGRYGYVCLWNLDNAPNTVTPSFSPADYFVRMRAGDVKITNVGDGSEVPFGMRGGVVSLGKITLPPYGWAIYEVGVR